MKIIKGLCHIGVDKMLKEALGEKLTIARFKDESGRPTGVSHWISDDNVPYDFTYDVEDEYDIKIIDDQDTWRNLKGIKSKHTVWYVHGTYHLWEGFQIHWNNVMKDVHILYPDHDRKKYIVKWYKHKPRSEFFLPIHLSEDYYVDMPTSRNGKAFTIGNELYKTCAIYGKQNITDQLFTDFSNAGVELYGFNGIQPPPMYDKRLIMGSASPIRSVVKSHSVSVHPSFVRTCGFALLECVAAGVPAVCPPKVGEYSKLFTVADNPASFKRHMNKFIRNENLSLDVGAQKQAIMREEYSISRYREKILEWLDKLP